VLCRFREEKSENNEVDKEILNLQQTESDLSQLNKEQEHTLDKEKPPDQDLESFGD
jgi:hypothetical protein